MIEAEWKEKRILSSQDNIKSIATYWMMRSKNSNYIGVVTWRDLSMDDVFYKINYTQTYVVL
ncbi:hypothetical protein EC501_03845 [Lysinibacillus halotolerans]|uniref:Uncharacterized protein n=1 Tax=Lysinibacillus halotolerans TaxID=1368476 RepID=A0A3M8HED3_9BACI|nr:hypothetical protein EC501_03845 [Lysinibacillus halotolerans]